MALFKWSAPRGIVSKKLSKMEMSSAFSVPYVARTLFADTESQRSCIAMRLLCLCALTAFCFMLSCFVVLQVRV